MDIKLSTKRYFLFLTLVIIICFKSTALPNPPAFETSIPIPQVVVPFSLKAQRIAEKFHLSDTQQSDLAILCEYIEAHWDLWMRSEEDKIVPKSSMIHMTTFNSNALTIHPSAREVCIYLEGHTRLLGEGAFKTVKKAISYTREEEVAVATPKAQSEFDNIPSIGLPISVPPSDGYWTPSPSSTHSTFVYTNYSEWFCEDYVREARILEKIQESPTVIQIYFIAFDWNEETKQLFPTIVGKYYNGGTLSSLPHKRHYSLEERLRICHDLLLALSDVHALNITHNDLHGGNILLQMKREGNNTIQGAYLSDFGLAKEYKDPEDLNYKARCYWDNYSLTANLKALFKESYDDENLTPEEQSIIELLDLAKDPEMTAEQIYHHFLEVLPQLVDAETAERVTQNNLIPRRMKIQKENLVEWKAQFIPTADPNV